MEAAKKKKQLKSKILKLKWLQTSAHTNLNLKCSFYDYSFTRKSQIRIFEMCYPLNSSFLMTDYNNRKECLMFGDYSEFKRVKQIIFDKKEQDYTYLLEEKNPEMVDKAYFGQRLEYYSSWLDSQNNQDAHDLAMGLRSRYNRDLNVNIYLNSNKSNLNHSKIHIRQFSKNT